MSPSKPFILRPIATSLLMLAILFVGSLAYRFLPVSSLPQVDYPVIRISTFYPGASPDVMTSLVSAPLERQFGQMPGLAQMTSTSSGGASFITLQFSLNMNLDVAEQEVQAAINAATSFLPKDLPNPPIYSKVNPADAPIMTLALTSKTMPLPKVEDLAETRFSQKISQLPGVGLVSISGGQRPAVRIQVNPTALAAYGLTLEDLRAVLVSASTNQPKGSLDGKSLSYTINANDQLLNSDDYKNLIIAYKNGAALRLSQVAQVVDDAQNIKQSAWINKTPAIILNIQRQPGANVIEVADLIKALLPKLQSGLPSAVDVTLVADRTTTIRASFQDAQFSLILAVCLVVFVIFAFLGDMRATLIASISVPLSLIGTFSVMYFLGYSLNNLTIMALTIATGFVVDDSIVMIENISRYVEKGESALEGALKGASQIGFTILSLTLSLIGVLIPLLFMADVVGRLFREFAITLSVTILVSAFVCLTLTPMMCARLLHTKQASDTSTFEHFSKKVLDALTQFYAQTLTWVLERQKTILAVGGATLVLSVILVYVMPKGFFPNQDTGFLQGISQAPAAISFKAMSDRQQALSAKILEDPAVENVSSFIGIDDTNTTLNSGRMLIVLKPLEVRGATSEQIIARLQKSLSQISGTQLYLQSLQDLTIDDRVTRNQYQYSMGAPQQEDVRLWSQKLMEKLQTQPQFQDVSTDLQDQGLQTMIHIDRDSASRLGITTQMIDDTLYDAFGQRQILTLFTQFNQSYVILETLPKFQNSPNALDHLYFKSALGVHIPFKTFVQVSEKTGPLVINRQSQFPVATLSFNLSPHTSLGEAVTTLESCAKDIQIPEKIQTSFEGTARIFQSALSGEGWLVLCSIIVVYILLGILYESYIHPITILSTLPSASMGALFTLWMTGRELSVVALIGIILLIGIVMKNAILMIDFALELERQEKKTPQEAIHEACLLRFRPILMTTVAALFGAVPLAFGSGIGFELRQPLGLAIIGGLMTSQLLTLYTTPVLYLTFDRLARAFRIFMAKTQYPVVGTTSP